MFRDLAKLFASQGPVNWEVARQIAVWTATEGAAESNVDPIERIRLEEISRVAELHVGDATGLSTSAAGRPLVVRPVGRGEWAMRALDAYRPLLELLATTLGNPGADDEVGDPSTMLLGNLAQVVGPVMLGMQSGFTAGHLARTSLGQYDLPIPRPPSDELVAVAPNLAQFAEDWSLPPDDLRLWVCLSEMTHHAVLARPHVRDRLDDLLRQYVSGFETGSDALTQQIEGMDPSDPSSMESLFGNPEALLGAIQSPAQEAVRRQLDTVVTVIEGYVDHVMDTTGKRLIASYPLLSEALRRRRVERGEGDRFAERLFGLELGQAQFDRGSRFVEGVVERAGEEGLNQLWRSERELPTPAEVDAPGLWLARLELD